MEPEAKKPRKDHYVAQTYLKHFAGQSGLLYAYRKSDGKEFQTRPQDVCHAPDDDIIPDFATDPEVLGKYRQTFEPGWNPAIDSIRRRAPNAVDKMHIAGYWAQLMVCTPTWQRIGVQSHNRGVHHFARAYSVLSTENGKDNPQLNEAVEMLDQGKVRITTDPNFIRAKGVESAIKFAGAIYNADWTVLENQTEIDFITSDNPAAFEDHNVQSFDYSSPFLRYLPLTPKLCIVADLRSSWQRHRNSEIDFTKPPEGNIKGGLTKPRIVKQINHWIAKCAENLVLANEENEDIGRLVRKYARFRVEIESLTLRREGSFFLGSGLRVKERSDI